MSRSVFTLLYNSLLSPLLKLSAELYRNIMWAQPSYEYLITSLRSNVVLLRPLYPGTSPASLRIFSHAGEVSRSNYCGIFRVEKAQWWGGLLSGDHRVSRRENWSSLYCSSRKDSGNVVLHDARPAEFNLTKTRSLGQSLYWSILRINFLPWQQNQE